MAAYAEEERGYLYFREITIAPYQNMREFFDLPDHPGHYDIQVLSEAMTPLTVHVIRLRDEQETIFARKRSFHLGNHRFQFHFTNDRGSDDLAIEVANSNPTRKVTVSMIIIEESGKDP